jgi:hypothetical protein
MWTYRQRILFVLGMSRHGRDFARIAQVVGRSAAETASYADRYFRSECACGSRSSLDTYSDHSKHVRSQKHERYLMSLEDTREEQTAAHCAAAAGAAALEGGEADSAAAKSFYDMAAAAVAAAAAAPAELSLMAAAAVAAAAPAGLSL